MINLYIESYTAIRKQEVIDLIFEIQTKEFGVPITMKDQPDLENIPGFYQRKNGNFWVAILDKKVVGSIALLDIGMSRGALRKMFVKAACRGKELGVGQALLEVLLNWAREKGFLEILLGTTERFIAAHRFIEKNKFIEIEKASLPREFPVMEVDVKFYIML